MYKQIVPVMDYNMIALCRKPYHNHRKGCPNWAKKKGCPPHVKMFDKVYDTSKPIYAIWNVFNFGEHVARMKEKHPEWTEHQVKCCLYWQPTARKELKKQINSFIVDFPELDICYCPEGMGVNITQTMMNIGEVLEWSPETKTYQIVLAGTLLK